MNATQAFAIKNALVDLCKVLFPSPVYVSYGPAYRDRADDIISVRDIEWKHDVTLMGTRRRREETVEVVVVFECFTGGDDQQVVTERAGEMARRLDDHLLMTDPNLGGVVREARMVKGFVIERDDDEGLEQGRFATVQVHIECKTHIG